MDSADLGQPQRQSLLAVVFLALRIVRSIGITQLVILGVFVISGTFDGRLLGLAAVALIGLGVTSALAWWRYTFHLDGEQLVVTKGIVRVDRLTVPFERIQSVGIDQELLHRITGLVKVTIDTAGSDSAEFTIDAIDRSVAEQLQARTLLADGRATPESATAVGATGDVTAGETIVFRHDARRLLVTALTSPPWAALVVLGPLGAIASQVGERVDDAALNVDPGPFRWWWIPTIAFVVVLASIVLNLTTAFLQNWDLTLWRRGAVLRRTSGLLSTTSRASSPTRVQVMSARQNPLQRLVGLSTVELSSIGDGDLSLPGCDRHEVDTVHALTRTTPPTALPLDGRIERAEIWLATRNATVLAAIVIAGGWFVFGWWVLLVAAVVPWRWAETARHVSTFRWSVRDELATRTDVVMHSTRQALLHKANAVRVTQTIFERRRGLGRLHLDTAAGTVSVGMIPIDRARAVRDRILAAAETDRRAWM